MNITLNVLLEVCHGSVGSVQTLHLDDPGEGEFGFAVGGRVARLERAASERRQRDALSRIDARVGSGAPVTHLGRAADNNKCRSFKLQSTNCTCHIFKPHDFVSVLIPKH